MSDHDTQKLNGIVESLTNAGIGPAYHRRTLADVAPALVAPAQGAILDGAREGRGVILMGRAQAYEELMLLARALHLQGVGSMVIRLPRLIRWIEVDADDMDRIHKCQALFVAGLQATGDRPFTGWQARLVEDLICERIDNGRAFFAQAERTLSGSGWWSDTFVELVSRVTSVRECNEP